MKDLSLRELRRTRFKRMEAEVLKVDERIWCLGIEFEP